MTRPLSAFAGTYAQARDMFAGAVARADGKVESIPHPDKGPDGTELATDIAWLGDPAAETVVLCLSGVHGAEGYAGSGAQVSWLRARGDAALPEGVALLMVHAVNPFGFAHGLRGTEDNIDVNRNWLDHSKPHPPNPLYAEIHPWLCPRDLSPDAIRAMLDAGSRFVERHGQWALEDAISRGQYTHPDGFHYGGTELCWSTRMLMVVARKHLAGAKRIAYVDFHSGPVGNGETIHLCFSRPESEGWRLAEDWWGTEALTPAHVEKLWGSKRPSRHGIVFWGLEALLAGQAEVAGAVVEFCSAERRNDTRDVMRIPMLERWLRFEGGLGAPEAPAYLAEIRNNYAPRRPAWEARVASGATRVLDHTLSGAARWHERAKD